MARIMLMCGALNALLCVVLGAFGSHALKNSLGADMLAVYQTGVAYHFFHALGLLAVGLLLLYFPLSRLIAASGWAMLGGIVLFSGSLYLLSVTGTRWIGAITPIGGLAFLLAWALLALGIYKS